MKHDKFGSICLLAAFVCGCSAEAPEPTPVERGEVVPESTVVALVKLSETHQVEFRENVDGIVSVIETAPIGEPAILGTEAVRGLSLRELYGELQKRAANPAVTKVDLARLEVLDELTSAARANQAAQAEELVDKAAVWRNYLAPNHADTWNWWSNAVCRAPTYRCEIGIGGSFSYTREDDYIVYSHFNMSTTTNSTASILWDPCDNAPFWEFCTKPFRVVNTTTVPPWHFVTQQNWSSGGGNLTWSANGNGPVWGWALTYSNPRTW